MPIVQLPSVSFVVPLFNNLHHTKAMLASLQASIPQGLQHEIILADDASTDGTADWLSTLADVPNVKTARSSQNKGYAANNNMAVRNARCDVLALLNNDLLLKPGWLEPMLAALADPALKAGVVGNVQRRVDDGSIDHAGVHLNHAGQLAHIQDVSIYNSRPVVNALAATGACMLLRRADFERVGGFEEDYTNGAEDIDLCFKLRKVGLNTCVALTSQVGHHVSLSRGPTGLNDERNSRYLYAKWRNLLKQQLAQKWYPLLANGEFSAQAPEPPEALIDASLLSTPHLASRRVAEALLARQEHRWAELLGPMRKYDQS